MSKRKSDIQVNKNYIPAKRNDYDEASPNTNPLDFRDPEIKVESFEDSPDATSEYYGESEVNPMELVQSEIKEEQFDITELSPATDVSLSEDVDRRTVHLNGNSDEHLPLSNTQTFNQKKRRPKISTDADGLCSASTSKKTYEIEPPPTVRYDGHQHWPEYAESKGRSTKKKVRRIEWNVGSETALLDLWSERLEEFRKQQKNGHIYAEMAEQLSVLGYTYSPRDVQNKLQNFTQRYRKDNASVGSSNESHSSWPHYEKVHQIIGGLNDLEHESLVGNECQALWKKLRRQHKTALNKNCGRCGCERVEVKAFSQFLMTKMNYFQNFWEDKEPTVTNHTDMNTESFRSLFTEMAYDPEVNEASLDEFECSKENSESTSMSSTPYKKTNTPGNKPPPLDEAEMDFKQSLATLNNLATKLMESTSETRDPFFLALEQEFSKVPENIKKQLLSNGDTPLRLQAMNWSHFPEHVPPSSKKQNPSKRCHVCAKHHIRSETTWQCKRCKVPLHLPKCFEQYHTLLEY